MATNVSSRYGSFLKSLLVNRYSIFLLFLLSYTRILENFGGLPTFWEAWRLEIPVLLYCYYILNLILRPSRLSPLLAAAPLVLYYVGVDVYYILFGRLPHIIEVAELPEMFIVYPLPISLGLGLLITLPLLTFATAIDIRKTRLLPIAALPLLALLLNVELFPESFMAAFEQTQRQVIFYSDVHSTRNNGRIGMMIYNEARRKSYLAKIAGYRGNSIARQEFLKSVSRVKGQAAKRNVHMLVLESFLDPTLMKKAQFIPSPVAPSFEELFHNKGGFSISPVFAGGTAQAEFEVLCGVPALRELSGVEFNVFTGTKTFCLPNILTQGGYDTSATNSFVPDFFNSTKAYAGVGFANTYYPSEYAVGRETYFSTGDATGELYVFDDVLLSQNLAFISEQIKKHPETPIFNYIISMYGHTPHDINTSKRPKIIEMRSQVKDDQMERSANQFYYRTKAIAAFVKGLIAVDPQSLIVLVSDHLPALSYGPTTYRNLDYFGGTEEGIHQNRLFIIENGRAVQYSTIHHFDIPRIVLNYVTKGNYCQEHACNFKSEAETALDKTVYRDEYMSIMAQAMGCDAEPPAIPEKKAPIDAPVASSQQSPAGV